MAESHHHEDTHEIASRDAIVPENATVIAVSALEPQEQEQAVLLKSSTITPAPAVKPSRLSLAFKSISNGCGLCFHPLRNNGSIDYHALVVTPADEDGPVLGEDHYSTDNGKAITEDHKEGHISSGDASGSADHYLSNLDEEHQEQKHKSKEEQGMTSTFIEEITVVELSGQPHSQEDQETVLERDVQEDAIAFIVPQLPEETTAKVAATSAFSEAHAANTKRDVQSTATPPIPVASRGSRPFARLMKRSSSTTNATPSSPSSSSSSPIFGRLGRLAKIIRSNEASASIQSKANSLQVTAEPSREVKSNEVQGSPTGDVAVVGLSDLSVATSTADKQNYNLEIQETVMSDSAQHTEHEAVQVFTAEPKELDAPTFGSESVSPNAATLPAEGDQTAQLLTQSPTLHQNDASVNSGSGQLLTKIGRSSTAGSTIDAGSEAENESIGSNELTNLRSNSGDNVHNGSKDRGDKRRKNSVLKKIGKIIKDKKLERKLSRQGSTTMASPIEADEDASI
ncbi:hypothetical protein EDD11_006209 [Mortierella claussenii]|nr:hypothetical protein EDD11_006209 [Mortierella claussenii]